MATPRFPALLLFLFAAVLARATSVEPPDFPALVRNADAIYRGYVTAVESRRVDPPGGRPLIRTYVTFAVERTLKGAEHTEIVLDFLGGTVGDLTLEVSDMPVFTVGDHNLVFVQGNGRQFCPLVAVMHGRYRIEHDAAANRDIITRENHRPLNRGQDVVLPMSEPGSNRVAAPDLSRALTPAEFEIQILQQVASTPQARVK
jgi:hypothetical protein